MTIVEVAKSISVWPKMTHLAELKQSLSSQMRLREDDDGGLAWIDEEAKRDFIEMASQAKPGKRLPCNLGRTTVGQS